MTGLWVRRIRVNIFVAYGRRWDDFLIRRRRSLLAVGPRRVLPLRNVFFRLIRRTSK
jgi:hypothetical protein